MGWFKRDNDDLARDLADDVSGEGRISRRLLRKLQLGGASGAIVLLLVLMLALGWYWSRSPDVFWVSDSIDGRQAPVGYASADAAIKTMGTLLDKPGGWLSNDVTPPSIVLDNIPNFEYGALVQIRDYTRTLRNDFSRSQSQSIEDPDLSVADPAFHFNHDSWILPRTEAEYRKGVRALERYRTRLAEGDAAFYARADNLRQWLSIVEKRLGDLSQRLAASVGQRRVNTALAGDPSATSATPSDGDLNVKTPWLQIDDVFYEARGSAWALTHLLRAAELDFKDVLKDKNAEISLRQVIRELESTQQTLMSPIVLNGSGFGMFANHSLVMASYLSRANAAVIDLRELLDQG
ncbi:MAG: DUF2333 family protein [Gammaproteobacteria bacterium]|nr:DUF2333 family protein [Gammaproteobacteria bacterium]